MIKLPRAAKAPIRQSLLSIRPSISSTFFLSVASSALLCMALPATAQDADEPTALEGLTIQAEAIPDSAVGPDSTIAAKRTTTGSKTDTEILDLSRSVSVVTEEEIRTRNAKSLEEALSYTAGVSADQYASDNRYDFYMIRGFNQTSLGTYRDGLTRRTVNFTGGKLEPYGLQRIDILKGSTSTLFGLNAPGGIVNAITKRPLDYKFGEVYTTLGKDHVETGADFGGPIDEDAKWTYRLTTKWQDAERDGEYTQDDRVYVAPALTYRPSDATSFTLLADYNKRDSNAAQSIPFGSGIEPDTFLGEPEFDGLDTTEYNIGYLVDHDFGHGLSFKQNARYTHLDLDYNSVYLNGDPAASRAAFVVDGERDQYSIDNQLHYDTQFAGIGSRTLVGFDYTHDDVTETSQFGAAGGIDIADPMFCGRACITLGAPTLFEQKQKSQGVYLQEELTFIDRWILTLGGRYDTVETETVTDTVNDHAFTTRAGLTFKATDELSLYGNYSESFQPPTSRNFVSGRAEPQEGEQYELGVKYSPVGTNALFTAAVFDLTQSNVSAQVAPNLFEQTGKVNVQGIELESKVALSDRLNVLAAYSYWDSEIEEDGISGNTGNRPLLVPEHIASLWADYTIPGSGERGDLTFGGGARYTGSVFVDNANSQKVDSHTLVDAVVRYALTPDIDVAVNANNLFDKEYISYIDTFGNAAFYGEGRTVLTTLRYHW